MKDFLFCLAKPQESSKKCRIESARLLRKIALPGLLQSCSEAAKVLDLCS
jgi:hypothetical protein